MKSPIKPNLKTEIIPALFLVLSIALSFYFYASFSDLVPTHWNAAGEVNGWSSKYFAAFFFPILNVGIYLLMIFIPLLDPRKKNYDDFKYVYHIIKGALVIFLTAVYLAASFSAIGYNIPIHIVVPVGVGILFIIIGYFLKDVKPNWFIGIRTPWTLSSDKVWEKTHKFGSKVFMLAGIILALASIFPELFGFFIGLMVVLIIRGLSPNSPFPPHLSSSHLAPKMI